MEPKLTGRPRTYDREKVAKDMLEWAKKDDSINMCGFSAEYGIIPPTILRWVDEDPIFRESYEEVRAILGDRREKLLSKNQLHVKAYDLNAKTYDKFLKRETRSEKAYDAKLKAQQEIEVNEAIAKKQDSIIEQLATLQERFKNKKD